jgi:transposase-like protein
MLINIPNKGPEQLRPTKNGCSICGEDMRVVEVDEVKRVRRLLCAKCNRTRVQAY